MAYPFAERSPSTSTPPTGTQDDAHPQRVGDPATRRPPRAIPPDTTPIPAGSDENQTRRVRQRTTAPPPSLTAIHGRTAADQQTVNNLDMPDNTGTNPPAPTNRKRRKEELLRKVLDVPQSSLTWLESLSDRDLLPRRQTPRTAPDSDLFNHIFDQTLQLAALSPNPNYFRLVALTPSLLLTHVKECRLSGCNRRKRLDVFMDICQSFLEGDFRSFSRIRDPNT